MQNSKVKKYLISASIIVAILAVVAILFGSLVKKNQVVIVKDGNLEQKPLQIVLGKYQDSDCGMIIESLKYAGEFVTKDGRTRFFHDIGGLAHYLLDKPYKDSAKIWVYSKDTNKWIDGREAWYSIDAKTPMMYGFGAYEKKKDGYIRFEELILRVARGETLRNPKIRKEIWGF